MFVIELTYKVDLAEIDAQMAAHLAFLNKYYASGKLLVSGRKTPRDGGIILAMGKDREQIEAIIHEDPVSRARPRGLASFSSERARLSQGSPEPTPTTSHRDSGDTTFKQAVGRASSPSNTSRLPLRDGRRSVKRDG